MSNDILRGGSREAISEAMRKKKRLGSGCLALFCLVFFTIGAGVFLFFTVIPLMKVMRASSWPSTPCVIVSSRIDEKRGDDGPTYRPDMVFRYQVDGKPHQSDQYGFTKVYSSGREGKQEIVDRYPPGSEHDCFYNPKDPSRAVLNRGMTSDMLVGMIGLIFLAVGAGGLLYAFGFFGGSDKKKGGARPARGLRTAISGEVARDPYRQEGLTSMRTADQSGEVTLESAGTPWGKVAFAFFFSLIWNGVVSVFLVIVVHSYLKGDPEVCLTVFLIPFVLVGIGVLLFFVHSLLALFNPRPVLTISSGQVALGDTFDLSWRFRGRTGSVRQLTVVLKGVETARYRRGTNTYTDTNDFLKVPIVDTTNPMDIESGQASVTVPTDSMHSFSGANNQITWTVHVHGDIGFWPDVDESFEILVLPHNRVPIS